MKQLVQNLKTGSMNIIDVPIPKLQDGYVLVRNRYSLISAGTEGNKVSTARMGYYGKAKEKPEQVRQVIETIKSEGISSTYAKVMNKLDSLSPLGYSTAGEVIDVGKDVRSVWVGDYVACAGANLANHAEIISVPENLVALVPSSVSLAHASYTTVASIAMQGIRQADLRLGESCVVIGLGLIGQITIQLLKASGVKSFGIDINQESNELAKLSGAEFTFLRGSGQEESAIRDLTAGHGADVVIITAATSSSDPVNLAGRLARKKGKIIIVGAVPTDFDRENYYLKELELKMATSYGPGRYDPEYEEKGHDYPIAYVRWTENRNMSSFVEMLKNKTVDMEMLTTHIFSFEEAERAYQMIIDKSEPFVGILLKYEGNKRKQDVLYKSTSYDWGKPVESPNISFIGAGAFAQNSLLPNIKRSNLISVGTTQGHTSANIATKWGFKRATTDPKSIISEDESNIIFIASRHHNHGELVCSGLSSKKSVFVEKPLCMTRDELEEIKRVYLENVEKNIQVHLMVGYNRRFSPCIVEIVS